MSPEEHLAQMRAIYDNHAIDMQAIEDRRMSGLDALVKWVLEQSASQLKNPEHPTKRELFAAMAMQGMCGDPDRGGPIEAYARDAVKFADALLAELAKERTE